MTAVEAQIRASSSSVRMKESASAPAPPYSSGTIIPRIPISARPATTSLGNRSCRSRSTTPGAIRVSANSRTASRIRVWSSVRSKFMGSAPDRPARKAEVRRGPVPCGAGSGGGGAPPRGLQAPPARGARRGGVHHAVLEVAERHDDLGTRRLRTQELDDPRAQRCQGIPRQRRDALRGEEPHPRPAYTARPPAGRLEHHYEEVALVVERVFSEGELR